MDTRGMKFSPRKTKSKTFCSVFGCSSKACRDEEVRFHKFQELKKSYVKVINKYGLEEMVDRQKEWINILKMGKKITTFMRVCSLHFTSDDYFIPDKSAGKRFLKSSAVPSCNLPKLTITETNNLEKKTAKAETEDRKINREAGKNEAAETVVFSEEKRLSINDEREFDVVDNIVKNPQFVDIDINVKSGDLMEPNFSNFITTEKELSTVTGISNFRILNTFISIVEKVAPSLSFYTAKLTVKDRIILTFMKLKQNVSYAFLAVLFKSCSERHIPNIICNILDILGNALTNAICFPSMEEISCNIPTCFNEYLNVGLILDCTEIEIQKPQNLCCQLATYSYYKSRYTVKFLTGCTPGGLLTFISNGYGRRASDKAIFEQSDLINLAHSANINEIMVDRGFLIDDICVENGFKVVRPPFLKDRRQFSETDALETSSIASARVHIERLNQRLKVFQILGSKMPTCLLKKCEHNMIVLSAVVNLSAPILSD